MDSPSSRALRLLALLQGQRPWTTGDLADRLGVGARTVRRDVARLRALGYDIRSAPGPGGAYRLAPGVKIPPLLLDADEVGVLVTALLVLEAGSPQEDSAATVRAKLEALLPPGLRRRAAATAIATRVLDPSCDAADWPLIGVLSEAVAAGDHLRFAYTDQRGRVTEREVQPYRQVLRRGHWYVVAFDLEREDWRLFRLDRIRDATPVRPLGGSAPREFPYPSIEHWLATDFGRLPPGDGTPTAEMPSRNA